MATNKKPAAKKAPAKKAPAKKAPAKKAPAKKTVTEAAETIVKDAAAAAEVEVVKSPRPQVKAAPKVLSNKERRALKEVELAPEEKIESSLQRLEKFLYNNGKNMLVILAIAVVVVSGFLAYKYLYVANRGEKAGAAMFVAEQLFIADDYQTALDGDGNNLGFLEIIEEYGSTPQANIAHHYAGICYLNLGDMENALASLAKYDTSSGVPNEIINAQNIGLQGDIYSQKGDMERAAQLYEKAISTSDDPLTTPSYLMKLGLVYDRLSLNEKAVAAFQRIKDEFPSSPESFNIDKYIGAQKQMAN